MLADILIFLYDLIFSTNIYILKNLVSPGSEKFLHFGFFAPMVSYLKV